MMCNIKVPNAQENENLMMTLLLRLDDKMNRQLSCEIVPDIESPICLANELVYYGFINQVIRILTLNYFFFLIFNFFKFIFSKK